MTALSPTSSFSRGGLISAQDLLGLMKTSGKSAFLRMKTFNSIMRTYKWKHRFVILANNEIYIYADEMSKRPVSCLPLLGCNQIKRYESDKYPWGFAIMGAVTSIKPRVFSCTTEAERKAWMRKIKEHLYKANDIERPLTDDLNQLSCGTNEEYIDLEEPIFLPDDVKLENDLDPCNGDEISGEEKSSEEDDGSGQSLPRGRKLSSGSIEQEAPPVPRTFSAPHRNSKMMADLQKRLKRNVIESKEEVEVKEKEEEEEEGSSSSSEARLSKFEKCLITDPNLERDREACKALLQDQSRLGAYLLRKSRQGESLVLVVLTENTDVKEFRLEEKNNLYRLQSRNAGNSEFLSIDALLTYFSNETFLPGVNHFLTFGIFECPDDTYTDM